MGLDFLFLGLLCLSGTVIALVIISKMPNHDDLIAKITLVLREEISNIKNVNTQQPSARNERFVRRSQVTEFDEIKMDESIIPTKMDIETRGSNLETATSTTKVIDKRLKNSKDKLKSLLQKKEK